MTHNSETTLHIKTFFHQLLSKATATEKKVLEFASAYKNLHQQDNFTFPFFALMGIVGITINTIAPLGFGHLDLQKWRVLGKDYFCSRRHPYFPGPAFLSGEHLMSKTELVHLAGALHYFVCQLFLIKYYYKVSQNYFWSYFSTGFSLCNSMIGLRTFANVFSEICEQENFRHVRPFILAVTNNPSNYVSWKRLFACELMMQLAENGVFTIFYFASNSWMPRKQKILKSNSSATTKNKSTLEEEEAKSDSNK